MPITQVRMVIPGENPHSAAVLNRPSVDLLLGSGYLADGSDFAGFASSGSVQLSSLFTTSTPVTVSTPLPNITQTWNASGTTFTGVKLNITNTASAADSKLLDLQVASASLFSVRKDGSTFIGCTAPVGTETTQLRVVGTFPSSIGAGVGRAAQFYSDYAGNNAHTTLDLQTTTSGTSAQDHLVTCQINVIVNTTGNTTNSYGIYITSGNYNTGTIANAYAIRIDPITNTGGGAITNKYSLFASDTIYSGGPLIANAGLTVNSSFHVNLSSTTNFIINTNKFTVAAATGNTVVAGTISVAGLGSVGIAQSPGIGLNVGVGGAVGTTQFGLAVQALFPSSVTVNGTASYIQLQTPATGFTMALGYSHYIDTPSKGAGSTIATAVGLYVNVQDQGATNWALYCKSSTTSGGVTFRDTALATGATVGHFFIPSCAGAPTGVPATIPTGQIALQFDSTNNFLYAYLGGWKKTTVFA